MDFQQEIPPRPYPQPEGLGSAFVWLIRPENTLWSPQKLKKGETSRRYYFQAHPIFPLKVFLNYYFYLIYNCVGMICLCLPLCSAQIWVCKECLGLRVLPLTSFMRSMMKVIEGHFNPLKRPDRTIFSCRLTMKVHLDSDERVKSGRYRENQTAEAGVVLLTFSIQHARVERCRSRKIRNATKIRNPQVRAAAHHEDHCSRGLQ